MISRTARACAADVARDARDRPSGPGVGRAGDPARVADDDRPAVAGDRLPRPARRDPPALAHRRPVGRPPGEDLGVARRWPAAARPAASSAGTIESTSRYSAGAWSLPPIGPRPSRLGTPMPGRRVGVGRAAGRGVGDLEPERPATRLGVLDQPAAALELLHRPPARPSARTRRSCRGPRSPRRCSRMAASAVSSAVARRRPDVDLERARARRRRWAACRRRSPDVDGHARPAAVERVQLADDPGRLEDRAAALLRLDAGVGRPAVDRERAVSRMPLRAETMSPLARAHSRTSATSTSAAAASDVRRRASASRSPRRGWR